MDIKIGLADTQRELVIRLPEGQQNIFDVVENAIASGTPTLKLADEKGREYLIRTERISYVEQSTSSAHSVGFMR